MQRSMHVCVMFGSDPGVIEVGGCPEYSLIWKVQIQ